MATGLRHLDGTSRWRDGPDTATSDFFVRIGDQPLLDFGGARNPDGQGFAAFGRVVHGMEVVRAIQAAPADGQSLAPPVTIRTVRRLPWSAAARSHLHAMESARIADHAASDDRRWAAWRRGTTDGGSRLRAARRSRSPWRSSPRCRRSAPRRRPGPMASASATARPPAS
ncbi:MAG: peptidylprolyl isomerase [Thermoanaerobaculia bacterium]